jgi:hypothetical protein
MRFAIATAIVLLACDAFAQDRTLVAVKVVGDAATIEEAQLGNDASVEWEQICVSPCIAHASSHGVLRAVGGLPSEPLKLQGEDVILRATTRPSELGDTSTVLLVLGGVLGVGSLVAIPIGATLAVQQAFAFCFSNCSPPDHSGLVLLGTGIGAAVLGVVMLAVGFGMRPSARARLEVAARTASMQVAF